MCNMNTRNYGVAIGRLVRPPKIFENKDGSRKIFYTLMAERDFVSREGRQGVDYVNLETFIHASSSLDQTLYSKLRPGMLLAASYTIRSSTYTDAAGQTKYALSLLTRGLELLDGELDSGGPSAREKPRKGGENLPDDQIPF